MAWDDEPMFRSKRDAMTVWRAIKKHLPHIAEGVEKAADPVSHFMRGIMQAAKKERG